MAFSLIIGSGGGGSFDSLGVVGAVLECSNQGLDKLQITLEDQSTLASFPPYSRVTLLHDGAARFVGWVDQLPASLSPERRQTTVSISGPWRWLDMTTFSTKKKLVDTNGNSNTYLLQTPMLNQGIDPLTGLPIKKTLREVINDALACVVNKYGAVVAYDLSGGGLDVQLPWSEKQNVTAGSVVRDQLSWAPDHSSVWQYSNAIPTLKIVPPSGPSRLVLETGVDATALTLNPRFDLLVNSVKITYLSQPVNGVRKVVIDTSSHQGDAAALQSPLSVDMTFPLQGGEKEPTLGLAARFHQAVCKLAIDTSFTYVDETMDWETTPGTTWSFSGLASGWSSYSSVCQTITRDLFTGAISLKLGHPGHLGLQQLIDLNRKNTPQANGDGGGGDPPTGKGSFEVSLEIVSGSAADKQEMIDSTVITATGPGGTTQQAAKDPSVTFSNLVPGSYLVSVVPAPGWKLVSNGSARPGKTIAVQENTLGASVTLFLERVAIRHPFRILLKHDDDTGLSAGVYYDSVLFESPDPGSVVQVTGLLDSAASASSGGWFTISDGDNIWLEITLDSSGITSAEIKHGSTAPGVPWSSGGITESDGGSPPKQTKARKVIAKFQNSTVSQYVFTNLVLFSGCFNGSAAKYPRPL